MIYQPMDYRQSIFWLVTNPRNFHNCMGFLLHCLMDNTRPECPKCHEPMVCFTPKGLWGDSQYWCDKCGSPHDDLKYDSYGRLGHGGMNMAIQEAE